MGIIQGLTEFLPVSSSAHLVIYPKIFSAGNMLLNSLSFDVALHGGTLVALLVFFRKKVSNLLGSFFKGLTSSKTRKSADFKMGLFIIAATIPAVIVGYFWGDVLEDNFRDPVRIGLVLIIFGGVLWLADRLGRKRKETGSMNFFDSIIIGLAQAAALIPGVSRSGVTISAGLLLGYKRQDAAEFSFVMSIPAVAGAFVMQLKHLADNGSAMAGPAILGFIAASISGMLAIKFLLDFVQKKSFTPFVIYRIALGILILAMFPR